MKLVIIMSNAVAVGAFNANCNTRAYPTKEHHVLDLTDEQINQIQVWQGYPLKSGEYSQSIDECWLEK